MDSIEQHIEADKEILQNPLTSPQQRRHIEGELHDLEDWVEHHKDCLLYTSPSPRDLSTSRMPSSA